AVVVEIADTLNSPAWIEFKRAIGDHPAADGGGAIHQLNFSHADGSVVIDQIGTAVVVEIADTLNSPAWIEFKRAIGDHPAADGGGAIHQLNFSYAGGSVVIDQIGTAVVVEIADARNSPAWIEFKRAVGNHAAADGGGAVHQLNFSYTGGSVVIDQIGTAVVVEIAAADGSPARVAFERAIRDLAAADRRRAVQKLQLRCAEAGIVIGQIGVAVVVEVADSDHLPDGGKIRHRWRRRNRRRHGDAVADKAVLRAGRVVIKAEQLALVVDAEDFGIDGVGHIDGADAAVLLDEAMHAVGVVDVIADDLARIVDGADVGVGGALRVEHVDDAVVERVAVMDAAGRVCAGDLAARGDAADIGIGRSGRIERGEAAVLVGEAVSMPVAGRGAEDFAGGGDAVQARGRGAGIADGRVGAVAIGESVDVVGEIDSSAEHRAVAADAGHGGALGEEFADRREAAVAVDEAALDVLVVDKGAENLAAVGDADALVVGRERR